MSEVLHRALHLCMTMIPEPNLWADLRDRDRSLDEVEYPPHHLEAVNNTRTLTLPRGNGNSNCNPRDPFLKEELELEPGHNHTGNGLHSGSAVTVSSAASMNNVNSEAEVMRQRQRWTRRWYLLVIVLLYIGLLASFSLNVSLLLRKPSVTSTGGTSKTSGSDVTSTGISSAANSALDNQGNSLTSSTDLQGEGMINNGDEHNSAGYAYTTSCLVKVPCESGNYWKCDVSSCVACPQGFYQPQWGQTSCWPCPFNTTTDFEGASSPTECKRHKCPFYAKDGMGILESPNFPGEYPAGAECHWRVRPNRNRRVLVIISSIHLDDSCGDLLTIRKTDRPNAGVIYESCQSSDGPVIFTGHSRNIWIDFVANKNSSGRGFQMSFLTIEDELGYLVDAIVNEDKIDSFDSRPNNMSIEDKHLLSRLLLLLNPNYSNLAGGGGGGGGGRNRRPSRRKKPIINVIEGTNTGEDNAMDIDQDQESNHSIT